MSLNNIQLSPQMLADLYPDVLVETHAIPMPVSDKLNYLGHNEKQILIIVNNENVAYVTDDELAFLTKVLGACELTIAHVAIINWNTIKVKDYQALLEKLHSKTVLLFNLDPLEFGLPIHFPFYQIQEFAQHTYLRAPALSQIEKDVTSKKQLWTSLKKMFCI